MTAKEITRKRGLLHNYKKVNPQRNRGVKYMKQKKIKLKGEIGKFTFVVGNFNRIDGITKEKISKDIRSIQHHHQPINIIEHSTVPNNITFSSSTYRTFIKIEHTKDHKQAQQI